MMVKGEGSREVEVRGLVGGSKRGRSGVMAVLEGVRGQQST